MLPTFLECSPESKRLDVWCLNFKYRMVRVVSENMFLYLLGSDVKIPVPPVGKTFFFFPKCCECIHCIPGICKDHVTVQEHAAMRMYICVLDVAGRKSKVATSILLCC